MIRFLFCLFFLAIVLASSSSPSSALAQPNDLHVDLMQSRESSDSEPDRARRQRMRARVGVAFSVLGISLGVGLLAPGIIWNLCEQDGDVSCAGNPGAATPLIATGTVVIAAGLAGLGLSAQRLRGAKRQLRENEREPPAGTLRFGPTGVTFRHRF